MKKNVLFIVMMFVFAFGCAGQTTVKTLVVGPDGKKVTGSSEESGVILAMAPGATGTVYLRISGIQGPDYFTGTIGAGETQFVSLKQGFYALNVTAERNGVIGRGYKEFNLQPLEKLALNVDVYFPKGESSGVTISVTDVTVPTVYIQPSDTIHTVPINGRGIVVAVDVKHDWATPLGLTNLHVSTGGATHPFTLANCDLQNANGVTVASLPAVAVGQEWDFSHTYSHYSAAFAFTGYDYQLPASTVTTFPIVCDISAGHDFVDFTVDGVGLDYTPYYYADTGSWANSILAE